MDEANAANELFVEEHLTRLRKLAARVDGAEKDLTKARTELRAAVAAANEAGVSLAAIGRELGISRQRVAAIIRGS